MRVGVTLSAAGPGISLATRPSLPDGEAAESVLHGIAELAERFAAERLDTGEALRRAAPASQALWQQLGRTERVVLTAVADGIAPTNATLAAEHKLGRTTLQAAADRLADQGHLDRSARRAVLVDPLLAEWLRRR
jgi:hypothetical protein